MMGKEHQSQSSSGSSAPTDKPGTAGPRLILNELERTAQPTPVAEKTVSDKPQELVSEAMRRLDDILAQWKQKDGTPPG